MKSLIKGGAPNPVAQDNQIAPAADTLQVYHQCRRAILNWDWRPGSKLVISELQARFRSRPAVALATNFLESEGYIAQSSARRYIVNVVNPAQITNHYRSIDFGYMEALTTMIESMRDKTINPIILHIIDDLWNTAMQAVQEGQLPVDDIFLVKYYYIMILAASRDYDLMNYVLTVDKLRYSRWISEAIDATSQAHLFGLNVRLHQTIHALELDAARTLLAYIFTEYRRLINIYIETRPPADDRTPLDYSLVGDENPSNYPILPTIDSDQISNFIAGVKHKLGDDWPHLFVDRLI